MSDAAAIPQPGAPYPFATRGEFLSGSARRYGTFKLPASGRTVRFQSLTEAELMAIELCAFERDPITEELRRDETGKLIRKEAAILHGRAMMILATLVDEAGTRLLSDADLDKVLALDAGDTGPLSKAIDAHVNAGRLDEAGKKNSGTS